MEGNHLLVALVSVALLASLALEAEAGASFHPRPLDRGNGQGGSTGKPSTRREVYSDVTFQAKGDRRNAGVEQVDLPPLASVGEGGVRQYRDLLMQLFEGLLGSDGQEN